MGLTSRSTGAGAIDNGIEISKRASDDFVIALAGNPNVGKSTVFNALTGMNQHTGNWPGKTVTGATGYFKSKKRGYILVDIPGTYSLMAHSAEEEVARNFICFGGADATVVVCDATCTERNLNLVLQTMEISKRVIVCINLMDEAKRKHIRINLDELSSRLGVPVVGVSARRKKTLSSLVAALDALDTSEDTSTPSDISAADANAMPHCMQVRYPQPIEEAVAAVVPSVEKLTAGRLNTRFLSLRLLEKDPAFLRETDKFLGFALSEEPALCEALKSAALHLETHSVSPEKLKDSIVSSLIHTAEEVCRGTVTYEDTKYSAKDRKIDKILTGRVTGYPIMLLLLAFIFWLTIEGANYPSRYLSAALFWVQDRLTELFQFLGAPDWLHGALVLGMYRVLAWVVSVMLPPMAIFFPLFTLMEDAGYLPRIAYNLDKPFRCCHACGKQALTMCMGFGCNAAGVIGCRIIDSPRERLLAILTNNFVPCNGRYPTLIAILSMFFIGTHGGIGSSLLSALLLTLLIFLGILATFGATHLLSGTLLRGVPSSFTLELPPFRRPQVGRVIFRSIFDRTLFVLGRSAAVAAPAGLLIWLMANITVGDASLLRALASVLDPFARFIGLDGVILMAFILGLPANEIVLPIIIMAYTAQGSITELGDIWQIKQLLLDNGWTWITAVCVMLFSLMHWPCSTTLITIKKETGSIKWTLIAALLPTLCGMLICLLFANAARLFTM